MLSAKGIEPVQNNLASQIVIVPKKDGTRRMCVHYRKLTEVTIPD